MFQQAVSSPDEQKQLRLLEYENTSFKWFLIDKKLTSLSHFFFTACGRMSIGYKCLATLSFTSV